jgi:protein gp37
VTWRLVGDQHEIRIKSEAPTDLEYLASLLGAKGSSEGVGLSGSNPEQVNLNEKIMAENTKIEWCDHTFNPWHGCEKISPGCANCYAAAMSKRNPVVLGEWGPDGTRIVASEPKWKLPLKWDREAKHAGVRAKVFCASIADVFEDWQGPMKNRRGNEMEAEHLGSAGEPPAMITMADVRHRLFRLIDCTPNLDWLVLTKRPENIRNLMPQHYEVGTHRIIGPRENLWLGVSVENQEQADKRIPELLKIPARVRFLSCEPLLEPLELTVVGCPRCGHSKNPWVPNYVVCQYCGHEVEYPKELQRIDWVIVGGESGPKARACRTSWIRHVVVQCQESNVPCFVKQMGANVTDRNDNISGDEPTDWPEDTECKFGEKYQGADVRILLKNAKGGNPGEWPEDLRVRQFPAMRDSRKMPLFEG